MDGVAPWAAGVVMAMLALFGLVVASRAVDLPFYVFGLALFLFGVAYIFGLIARHTGSQPPSQAAPGEREDAARDARALAADPGDAVVVPAPRLAAAAPQQAAIASGPDDRP